MEHDLPSTEHDLPSTEHDLPKQINRFMAMELRNFFNRHQDKPWNRRIINKMINKIDPEKPVIFFEQPPCELLKSNFLTTNDRCFWNQMTENPNLSEDFIEQFINKPWDWVLLSQHKAITPNLINKYLSAPWDWGLLSYHPNLKLALVVENPNRNWDWHSLSFHPNFKYREIEQHLDLPWEKDGLLQNPTLTREDFYNIINNASEEEKEQWFWSSITEYSVWTIKILEEEPDNQLPWDWEAVSRHADVSIALVERYIDKPWSWIQLSQHANISLKDIEEHPTFPWEWKCISGNPNLTLSFFLANQERNWNYTALSRNNEFVSMEVIDALPELPWQWCGSLSTLSFQTQNEKMYNDYARQYIMTKRIQRWWRKSKSKTN